MSAGDPPDPGPRGGVGGSAIAGIAAGAGVVAAITLLARAAGFGRWLVFSDAVGATCVGDVYTTANQVPNVLFEVAAGGALAAAAVPLVARQVARGDWASRDRAASALLTWAVLVLTPLSLLLLVLAGPLASVLLGSLGCDDAVAGSAGAATLDAGTLMLSWFAPQVLLYGVGIVLGAILHAHRRFVAAALAPLLSTLGVIVTYAVYGAVASPGEPGALEATADLTLLAAGTTAGVLLLSLPLLVPVRRLGVRLRPTLHFPPGAARQVVGLLGAGVAVVAAQQVATLSGVLAAGRFGGTGTVAVLSYTLALHLLPYAVLVVPLAITAFPALVEAAGEEHAAASPGRDTDLLGRVTRAVFAVSALGAGGLVAAAPGLGAMFTALDIGAGSGTTGGQGMVALAAMPSALRWFALGLVGFGLVALLTRAAYATGHGAAAAGVTVLGWAVAGVGPWIVLGAAGGQSSQRALETIGQGWAVGMTLAGLGLLLVTRRHWGAAALRGLRRTAVAVLPGVAGGAALGWWWGTRWETDGFWAAVLQAFACGVLPLVTGGLALLLADPGTVSTVRRRGGRRASTGPDTGRQPD